MYTQQGMGAMKEKEYDKAIDMFANAINLVHSITNFQGSRLFLRQLALVSVQMMSTNIVGGARFSNGSLWPLIHQQKCEVLRAAGRIRGVAELLNGMMHDQGTKGEKECVD